ncbi:hypothetical protein VTO42DRAFT_4375 [Malbranchea cinnamomea]
MPPADVRKVIPSDEWKSCLDAWIFLVELRLRMSENEFASSIPKDDSTKTFLTSYFREEVSRPKSTSFSHEAAEKQLRRICFLLTRRYLLEVKPLDSTLLDWRFLSDFSDTYAPSSAVKLLLSEVWGRHSEALTASMNKGKSTVMSQLSLKDGDWAESDVRGSLRALTLLASSLPWAGQILLTGSDYIDTLFEAYKSPKCANLRRDIVANTYVAFTSSMKLEPPPISLLLDQLYSLKASAQVDSKSRKAEPTLLSDLLCSTSLLPRVEALLKSAQQKRGLDLIGSLRSYQADCKPFHQARYRRPKKKDKGKARAADDVHVHKMSLVTQIQDLFPNLGSGYILRLLDYYSDEVETVIAHLLEGTLPPDLKDLDPTTPLPELDQQAPSLSPRSTPPPPPPAVPLTSRKNIHDNDAFDRLEVSSSQVHIGRQNPNLTADDLLADRSGQAAKKAAILSALATFDSDDDERDDTYDVADVGGTIDTHPPGTDADADETSRGSIDAALFKHYKSSPDLFARDAATRRSKARMNLRQETGLTDEAIEGWAVMLARDPKKLARLEREFALEAGIAGVVQPELPPTGYRKGDEEGDETDGSDGRAPGPSRGRGGGRGARGRGRGRGGRGGGGNEGGSNAGGDALARRRKDANKASRANHNRRNQRAKKMARAGL